MKYRILSFLFVTLFSLLYMGCQSQNDTSIISSSENSSQSSNLMLAVEENQSLYNRIILDYYEQRLMNQKTISSHMYNSIGSLEMENRPIEEIKLNYLIRLSKTNAYIVDAGHTISSFGTRYFYSFNANNTTYQVYFPDIWYQGRVLYFTDAYYAGILNDDDVSFFIDFIFMPFITNDDVVLHLNDQVVYDTNVTPIDIPKYSFDSNSFYSQMREDLFNSFIKENADFGTYNISLDDIHIYQSFAKVEDAICVNFSIDGITPPRYICNAISKNWDVALSIDNNLIEPFQNKMPIVYVNRRFYPIDEAYKNKIISSKTALELLEQYQKSSSSPLCGAVVD